MKVFQPHAFRQQIELLSGPPMTWIEPKVYDQIFHIVDLSVHEVSWLGRIIQLPDWNFLLQDLFIFKQAVHATRTNITKHHLIDFGMQLMTERPKEAVDILNDIRLWGHSHVDMETGPSDKDERTFLELASNGHPWFIRLIANKLGRLEFTIFLKEQGVIIHDAPWAIYHKLEDTDRAAISQELKAKVTYVPPTHQSVMYLPISSSLGQQTPQGAGPRKIRTKRGRP